LWRTSPLGATVALVHAIAEGRPSSVPQQFTAAGTNIFFTAYTPEYGRELWAIDRPAPPAPGMGQLAITMPANGVVIGPGLACGSTGGACTVVLPIGARVGIEAIASAGFRFAGWNGPCAGNLVTITGDVTCGARFSSLDDPDIPSPTGPIRLSLDSPSGIVTSASNGRGFAFACAARIVSYELLIDAIVVPGVTFTATVRSDVPAVFASECPSVGDRTGFSFILDPARLAGGVQNVQVRVTDSNGRIATTN